METKDVVISAKNLTKNFRVYFDKGSSMKEKILFSNRRKYQNRTVLNDISFEVKRGEAVGFIGENGCGKSTTLKLLSRIMFPDQGTITIDGRVSALIELGAGFHPDMSGRENIYINAAIFGLSRAEIDERLQSIIDFSELGKYIDNPVRTYSSGMYMRLAFSIAINVDADVLLVDEILAVGDAAFQAKCFNRMREIKAIGTTIVIVSHALGQIEQICDRTIWISDGKIRKEGSPREVHADYLEYMGQKTHNCDEIAPVEAPKEEVTEESKEDMVTEPVTEEESATVNTQVPETNNGKHRGNGAVRITSVRLLDANGMERDRFATGEFMKIEFSYKVHTPVENPICGIGIYRNDNFHCYGSNTLIDGIHGIQLKEEGTICCEIPENMLMPGVYLLDVAIHAEDGFAYDYFSNATKFTIYSNIQDVGILRLKHNWKI